MTVALHRAFARKHIAQAALLALVLAIVSVSCSPDATEDAGSTPAAPATVTAASEASVSTLAGVLRQNRDILETVDGPSDVAKLGYPGSLAIGKDGSIYFADFYARVIRKIDPAGMVTTVAGNGQEAVQDGPGRSASFMGPADLAVAGDGTIYVSDAPAHRIRRIGSDGMVTTLAGGGQTGLAQGSLVDGRGADARFNLPAGLAFDNEGNLLVVDKDNAAVRRVTPLGDVTTVATGLSAPVDIAFSPGALYVTDHGKGKVAVIRGSAVEYLDAPVGRASDLVLYGGRLFLADPESSRILVLDLSQPASARTLAGAAGSGYADGPVARAQFRGPGGIAVLDRSRLLITDAGNGLIRVITGF